MWETGLRDRLGLGDDSAGEFWQLWDEVVGSLRSRGIKVGPFSFHEWNDGDAGFVRAIWRVVRHSRPTTVIETGVAHGITSRFILEALDRNGSGNLWSIDLPPFNPQTRKEVGVAVDEDRLRSRWHYIAGTSRQHLPRLADKLRTIDIFIHDSMHTRRNVTFELETAWARLNPGGIMLIDDIDANPAFKTFVDAHPDVAAFVCTAEPLGIDHRRFNQKGLFGIICDRTN
jgi:predicted O-methyltransferase YrrM